VVNSSQGGGTKDTWVLEDIQLSENLNEAKQTAAIKTKQKIAEPAC
jgi:uncharacterized circularly permuted ATP-grasp superfamily protein